MNTKSKLEDNLREAMKAGDEVKKRTIRMALAAIKQTEVDRQVVLDEPALLGIVQKEIKMRRESIEEARRANRPDLVASSEAEINVLDAFLPPALNANELKTMAEEAIKESGAAGPAEMGKVMKLLLPRVAGRAPNDQVSALVRQLLQK